MSRGAALFLRDGKACAATLGVRWRVWLQGLQRRIQLRRVLGLDDAQVGARVAKPVEDALGHVHLRLQPLPGTAAPLRW